MQFSPDILNHGWRDYGNRVGLWRIMEAMDGASSLASLSARVGGLGEDIRRELYGLWQGRFFQLRPGQV